MKVIMLGIGEEPVLKSIGKDLSSQQEIVGGFIQYVPISFGNKPYYLVVNEEGKLENLPFNKNMYYNGELVDIVVGNGFIAHHEEGKDLNLEDLEIIKDNVNFNSIYVS